MYTTPEDGRQDFDFWLGKWTIHNRRLLKRLQNCTEWEEFTSTGETCSILGGMGNIDDFLAPAWRPELIGGTLRLFNPATQLWSIYWMDNQSGCLQPPVTGRFEHGIGQFDGHDELDGVPIIVRFTWDARNPDQPSWQQAFSKDQGENWEVNWIMTMNKAA